MSLFSTKIPIDIKSFLEALPKEGYIHSISLDRNYDPQNQKECPTMLVIEWESHHLNTGYTFPVEFPLNDLKKSRVTPSIKKLLEKAKAAFTRPEVKMQQRAVSAPNPAFVDPQLRTSEQLQEALSKGKTVEYQGVEAVWLKVVPGHEFTDGFYYRVASSPASQPETVPEPLEAVPADIA